MRVISGAFRGRPLLAPAGVIARPTTDRVKESIFAIIQGYVPGAAVLDLFAGTGALGIEAVSRGAESAVFVDASRKSAEVVKKNLAACGTEQQVMVMKAAQAGERLAGQKFDLIFLDPPYAAELMAPTLEMIVRLRLLAEDGLIVAEHDAKDTLTAPAGLRVSDTRRYGTVGLTFFKWEEEA